MRPIDVVEEKCTFCENAGPGWSCNLQHAHWENQACFVRHEKVCPKAEEVREEIHKRDLEEAMSWDNYGGD